MSDPRRTGPVDERALTTKLRRWQRAGVVVFVLLVAAFPAYRAVEATRRDEALAERQAALVAAGRDLWAVNCSTCHGPGGEGLPGFPALNAREFLEEASDGQIHHLIAGGVPGTAMAAWWNELGGPLTDDQIQALVAFIRSWESSAPSRPDWRSPAPPSPSPEESPAPEESPSPEAPERAVEEITVTERGCEPLEIEVGAGRPFTLRYANQTAHGSSFEAESLGQHQHAPPGETITMRISPLQEGDYAFECLGETHGDLLGAGVIRAV